MASGDFTELEVYRLAEELADIVWNEVTGWQPFPRNAMGLQWVRAADSVGANIAEGRGRRDVADHKRFIRIAWGSLNETEHFLRRACKRNLLSAEVAEGIRGCIESLGPKLNAYHRSLGGGR